MVYVESVSPRANFTSPTRNHYEARTKWTVYFHYFFSSSEVYATTVQNLRKVFNPLSFPCADTVAHKSHSSRAKTLPNTVAGCPVHDRSANSTQKKKA